MSNVALVKCETYEYNMVKNAVIKGLELLGGINKFIKKDEKVLLKPNILGAVPPEKGNTTHPSVFKAVAEIIKENKYKAAYGDSPGFATCENASRKSGLEQAAKELGIMFADFKNGRDIFYEKGIQNKHFFIANAVLDHQCIISIPKLKTHFSQKYTGCIKNQFGCIPGLKKSEFHARIPDYSHFAKMLLDLNNFIKPRLYIMDAILSMEGNGPSAGKLRKTGMLLFSTDPIALDSTACRLINLDPLLVPTIKFSKEFDSGVYEENKINILGEKISDHIVYDFDVDRKPVKNLIVKGIIHKTFNRLFVKKPYIIQKNCKKCANCVNICPVEPKALFFKNHNKKEFPFFHYNNCIRCYCCLEVCPHEAIGIKTPILRKIFKI
ncbi:MAG: DUF362 domain-containing protein [Spirochaetes bacterium]|nr:DUF362 domain-containing protein [Spirochaetota bacterium]